MKGASHRLMRPMHSARAPEEIYDRRSLERKAVEALMRATGQIAPLTAVEVAARCEIAPALARGVLNHLAEIGLIENVTPHTLPAHYAMRIRVAAPPPAAAWRDGDDYDGRELRPYVGRPGAMRAFELPSLVDGTRTPRRPPILIGESLERK
jgi:ribosomal protein S25